MKKTTVLTCNKLGNFTLIRRFILLCFVYADDQSLKGVCSEKESVGLVFARQVVRSMGQEFSLRRDAVPDTRISRRAVLQRACDVLKPNVAKGLVFTFQCSEVLCYIEASTFLISGILSTAIYLHPILIKING